MVTVREQIAERLVTAQPFSDTLVRYRYAGTLSKGDGIISRRQFYLTAPGGFQVTETAMLYYVAVYRFDLILRIEGASRTFGALFDDVVNECSLLIGRINLYSSWPNGIRKILAESARVEAFDSGDYDLIVGMVAEVEETDGA